MPCARGNWVERGTYVMADLKVRPVLMSLLAKSSRDTRPTHPFYFLKYVVLSRNHNIDVT